MVEQAWFAGFGPWLLVAVSLFSLRFGLRRSLLDTKGMAVLGGILLTLVFFTKSSGSGTGVWIWLAEHVEPLRAFRASGRVGILLQFTLILFAGLALSRLRALILKPGAQRLVLAVAVLLADETLGHLQPSSRLDEAERRVDALVEAWQNAGDRPVLAFAPGFTNQPEPWQWLDAWSAAMRLRRHTINGFSGALPGSHAAFMWAPTPENALKFAHDSGVGVDRVTVVESYGAIADVELGFTHSSQRAMTQLEGFDLQPSIWILTAPLEHFILQGMSAYQFTPTAEVRFILPDHARRIRYFVGFRPDAYSDGGHTDGAGITWLLKLHDRAEETISYELIDPVQHPPSRGLNERLVELPSGNNRILILRTDTGPQHSLAWDFLLLARLRIE